MLATGTDSFLNLDRPGSAISVVMGRRTKQTKRGLGRESRPWVAGHIFGARPANTWKTNFFGWGSAGHVSHLFYRNKSKREKADGEESQKSCSDPASASLAPRLLMGLIIVVPPLAGGQG